MRRLVALCAVLVSASSMEAAADGRETVLKAALAHWTLGDGGKSAARPLTQKGKIDLGVAAQGDGAVAGGTVARLREAYFDAGKDLNVSGQAITVYLRARDPRGEWSYGLFSKRGGHQIVNFNLFSVDLPGTPGPDIGFEIHTDQGFVMASFPVSAINPTAWHDLAGRYDGKAIEVICDGKVMAKRAWRGGNLTQNEEPVLIGAETDNSNVVRLFTGEMEEAALWANALNDEDMAALMREEKIMPDPSYVEPYASPIHYRPAVGRLADTIPFFWKGEYHVFYLRALDKVPWEHLVTADLIHWKELPTALRSDGAPDGPDGLHMFTGSVTEHEGTFHIFYTGWNPANSEGREKVMHATSPDLITWTKHPEHGFFGDGVHYQNSDFRDPYVFWNDAERMFWMVLCARDAKTGKPVQGLARSKDLVRWEQTDPLVFEPPLGEGTPECPDLFKIGGTYYLIDSPSAGTTDMRYAKDIRGPYRIPETPSIDSPILYAAKRMFDGKRHIITGWIRDLTGERDGGGFEWGGDQSVPREVYAGPNGLLCFRPAPEAVAVFKHTVFARSEPIQLEVGGEPTWRTDVPDNYLFGCQARLDPNAEFTVAMRQQEGAESGYRLTIRPSRNEAEISGKAFKYARPISVDLSKPVQIEAFVQGSIIECFINDAYPFSCRAYDHRSGKLVLSTAGGAVQVLGLSVRTPE